MNLDIFNQLPGYIGWKDIAFKHQGCNQNLANILGLKNSADINGLVDSDLHSHDEKLIQFHQKNDELAVSGKTIKAIHRSKTPYDGSYFYFIKKPLLNENNEIKGVIYHCQEFDHGDFFSGLHKAEKKHCANNDLPSHYYLNITHNKYHLSPRELESLFFLLRGKTAKQIAEILKLSMRTIESYLEQIKNKFGCQNKAELIYLAMLNGYLNFIPPSLLEIAKKSRLF